MPLPPIATEGGGGYIATEGGGGYIALEGGSGGGGIIYARVTAVTSGFYAGRFRTAGDVFDIFSANDFSDSSVNYQAGGGESGFGWMTIVASNAPLINWLASNNAAYLPPQDPLRRFVF